MKQGMAMKVASIVSVVVLSVVLAGCTPGASTSATDAQQANRAYMSQVNETMVEIDENLDHFVDAVSRGDVVNMRTQADNAYKVIDKLKGIEPPEDMKSVHADYVEGTTKLRDALDQYITLYTDMSKDQLDFDQATYDARIAEIQALYDEGVALLQKGDATIVGSGQSASSTGSSIAAATSSQSSSAPDSAQSSSTSSSSASSASDSASSSAASDSVSASSSAASSSASASSASSSKAS